jgi:hypothetical protein
MFRNQEEDHGAARSNGQEDEEAKPKDEEKELATSFSRQTSDDYRTSDPTSTSRSRNQQPTRSTAPG